MRVDPKRDRIGDASTCGTRRASSTSETVALPRPSRLTRGKETGIYDAIHFGSILQKVFNEETGKEDYDEDNRAEDSRVAYPLHFIPSC